MEFVKDKALLTNKIFNTKLITMNQFKQIIWKKIYTLMLRIQMKLELFLNQKIILKTTSTKV